MTEIVLGQRKQGKSTWALARCAQEGYRTIIIFDPNDNYRSIAFDRVAAERISEWMERVASVDDEIHIAKVGPFDTSEIEVQFGILVDALWNEEWADYALIIDEANLLQKPSYINEHLDRLWRRCPQDVFAIQTSHRFYELHTNTRYLVDRMDSFRVEVKRERDFADDRFFPGLGDILLALGDRQIASVERNSSGRLELTIHRDPAEWFIDLRNPNARQRTEDPQAASNPAQAED